MESLASRLISTRLDKGFATQESLAKAAKIRQSFIGALEAGGQKTSGYLPEIAHALGVDAYWLKTGIKTLIAGDQKITDVVEAMKKMSSEGKAIVLHEARKALADYPAADRRQSKGRLISMTEWRQHIRQPSLFNDN